MAASPNIVSHGDPMTFTKDEATAAQRTWLFYLSNSADGTPATGKTLATTDFKISKNGAAFGNAAGVVTEMSLGWYKMVFDAADVDTIGALACELSGEAGVDTLHVVHQIRTVDDNTALLTQLATVAKSAEVQAITLATRTVVKDLGVLEEDGHTNADGGYAGISILDAIDAMVTLGGDFDTSTVTIEVTDDPAAAVPIWTTYDDSGGSNENPATAAAEIIVLGHHSALRAVMSSEGAASAVTVSVAIRKAANT